MSPDAARHRNTIQPASRRELYAPVGAPRASLNRPPTPNRPCRPAVLPSLRRQMPPPERDGRAAHGPRAQQHHAGRAWSGSSGCAATGTLWLPGTDHAGIATQNVVERAARARKGKTRFDLGRDEFERRVWAYVEETGRDHPRSAARHRLAAATGTATYFTLDAELSRAVREVVRAPVREGTDLPRQVHHQLVPALPDRALRRGSGKGRGRRASSGTCAIRSEGERPPRRGHHASRDDARRHRRRGASRTTSATGELIGRSVHPAARGPRGSRSWPTRPSTRRSAPAP